MSDMMEEVKGNTMQQLSPYRPIREYQRTSQHKGERAGDPLQEVYWEKNTNRKNT